MAEKYIAPGNPPYVFDSLDLSNKDISDLDLKEASFKHTKLQGTIFKGTKSMEKVDLTEAKMGKGTDFSGLDLSTVKFGDSPDFGSDASNLTNFTSATIPYSGLGTDWSYLNLSRANITGLPTTDLSDLIAQKANLSYLNLSGKNLKRAVFIGSNLTQTNLSKCELANALFTDANLLETDLSEAKIPIGVFNKAKLTRTDFTRANLDKASFLNARMEGTKFVGTDVTTCAFSSPPFFSKDINNITSFHGSKVLLDTLRREWSFLDLTSTDIIGLNSTTDLTDLSAEGTILTGHNLTDYKLDKANFSRATLNNTLFDKAKLNQARFLGVKGTKTSFVGAFLNNASFARFNEQKSVLLGAKFEKSKLNYADFSYADLGQFKEGEVVFPSIFNNAEMENIAMDNTNLTGAKLLGGIAMHNSSLIKSTLIEADLTGIQLGSYSILFTVNQQSQASTYTGFLNELNGSTRNTIKELFRNVGRELDDTMVVKTLSIDYLWTITCRGTVYTINKWRNSEGQISLVASSSVIGSKLTNANMKNANLTNADLRGVTASTISLEGSGTKLAGIRLDEIRLVDAQMRGVDLTRANLYKADLTRANLINAKLCNTVLTETDFTGASIEGTDFIDATMDKTNLDQAAVSVIINPLVAGVYLYSLNKSDTKISFENLKNELNTPTSTLKEAQASLNDGDLSNLRYEEGSTAMSFSDLATVETITIGKEWLITDPSPRNGQAKKNRVWVGKSERLASKIFVRPEKYNLLVDLFKRINIELSGDMFISKNKEEDQTAVSYTLNNNAGGNPKLGPMVFHIIVQAENIKIYATYMGMYSRNERNEDKIIVDKYNPSKLCADGDRVTCNPYDSQIMISDNSTCPNGRTLYNNKKSEIPWLEMLKYDIKKT
jgi:uncharacterized protein YjbI with pentapeptide repeats